MKRQKAVLGTVAAVGMGLAAIGWASASPASPAAGVHSAPASVGGQPALVSSAILSDGAEQEVFSNGTTFVGTPGTTVTFTGLGDGTAAGGYSVSVTPPDPRTAAGAAAMARAYAARGRSPAQDARDLGLAPTSADVAATKKARAVDASVAAAGCTAGQISDSGTLSINDAHITERGAFRRYTTCDADPNNHYTYEESQLSGQGKDPCLLGCSVYNMGTEHYYLHGSIIKWAPGGNMTTGSSCSTQTVGLSAYGVSVSDSVPVCPDRIRPSVPTKDFKVQWEGCTSNGSTKAADALSSDKVANGVSAGFTYVLYYNWNYC
jgi:hypothetical protein